MKICSLCFILNLQGLLLGHPKCIIFFFYFFNITYRALSTCHDPHEYGKRRLALSELMVQLGCSEYGEVHGVQEKEWQTHISEVTNKFQN